MSIAVLTEATESLEKIQPRKSPKNQLHFVSHEKSMHAHYLQKYGISAQEFKE